MIYEYFEREVPAEQGEIAQNISILYPGTIDGEYDPYDLMNQQAARVPPDEAGPGRLIGDQLPARSQLL